MKEESIMWQTERIVGLFLLVAVGVIAVSIAHPTLVVAEDDEGMAVKLKQIGDPIWKPADFHVFTAAIGTPADNFGEFQQNEIALLPPPNHQVCSELGIGPGAPHQPPYNREIDG